MRDYVRVESLCKSFGAHQVLADVSFSIRERETVAVTGPSGCGKTTLLNILGLLDSPDSGTVALVGRRYPKIGGRDAMLLRRTEVNYLFQSFALIESRTVRDNLMLALRYTKLGKAEKRAKMVEALSRFGLANKLDAVANELSGGEKQRVAICRAMLKPGNLILADEPTGSLDARMAGIVMDALVEATHREGKTLVVVTHDMAMAEKCGRVEVRAGAAPGLTPSRRDGRRRRSRGAHGGWRYRSVGAAGRAAPAARGPPPYSASSQRLVQPGSGSPG